MKFQELKFDDANTQRVYNNYIKQVKNAVKPIPKADQEDVLMDFNSHIYESLEQDNSSSKLDILLNAIDKLGEPSEVLKPLVADKMMEKATRTFNPIHVLKALVFNIANGISYVFFAILYLFLFLFVFMIGAKILDPKVGMYYKDGEFMGLGKLPTGEGYYELLGNWFIPAMILTVIVLYFFITLLLRLKKSLTKSKVMKSTLATVFTIALLLLSIAGFSQQSEYARLDNFFSVLEEHNKFFGSVAVSQGGEVVYTNAIGYANLEAKVPNDSETKFRIGSITKTFTSILIMEAVELGKIELDENIKSYFPEIKNAKKITIRQLLNHRSGINTFTDGDYMSWNTEPITEKELLEIIVNRGNDFKPNEKHEYSNSNYVLLTWLLEDIFQKSYEDLLTEFIIEPLDLVNTSYGGKIDIHNNEALSYAMESEWTLEKETDMSVPLGAGGIISTPTDLCLFAEGLFDRKLVSEKSLEQMKPVADEFYGFALFETELNDMDGIGHTGGIDKFTSSLFCFAEEDICLAITSNGSNFSRREIASAVLNEILGTPYEIPTFEYVEVTSEELDQYVGIYTSDDLPMDLTISRGENALIGQGTGQSSFQLSAEGDHKFSNSSIGLKITFLPQEEKLKFIQGSHEFDMSKSDENTPNEAEQAMVSTSTNEPTTQFEGTYGAEGFPMNIKIFQEGETLMAQADGQDALPLKKQGQNIYLFDSAGIKITFSDDKNSFILNQAGQEFELSKL